MAGFFSGYFYVDVEGTWNGSVFTITVSDLEPRFFYFSTYRAETKSCSDFAGWSSFFRLPANQDVLFALNPVFNVS